MTASLTRSAQQALNLRRLVWGVSVLLISVLAALLVTRGLGLGARIERLNLEQTLHLIDSALAVESALARGRGDSARLAALMGADPMAPETGLTAAPRNYLGRWTGTPETVPPGHWAFDAGTGTLIYALKYPRQVLAAEGAPRALRFRVVPADAGWLRLRPEQPYRWRE